jgi:F-type H+-transporting ATPase subunit delta
LRVSALSEQKIQLAGDQALLARRYAGALYELADKEGAVDTVATDLRGLRRLWDESAEWRFVASDPRLAVESVLASVKEVVKSCGFGKLTGNFLGTVAENARLSILPTIIHFFLDTVAAKRGEFNADVRVARPLAAAQREALTHSLTAVMGGKIHLNVSEDPGLLGGMTVKIGSQFIDASVKSKLDHLERTLKGAA